MHEARPVQRNWLRQVVFPLLIAVVLVVGALLVCGSSLIRIEDYTSIEFWQAPMACPTGACRK